MKRDTNPSSNRLDSSSVKTNRFSSEEAKLASVFGNRVDSQPVREKILRTSAGSEPSCPESSIETERVEHAHMSSFPRQIQQCQVPIKEFNQPNGDDSIIPSSPEGMMDFSEGEPRYEEKRTEVETRSCMKSRSDFSLSEKGFSEINQKDLAAKKKQFILYWVWAFFLGNIFALILQMAVFTQWSTVVRFLLMGILGGEIFVGVALWLIHKKNRQQYVIYSLSAVLFCLFCGKTFIELKPEQVVRVVDEESFIYIFSKYLSILPPVLQVMIISGIFIGLEYIETQRMRKQFFIFFSLMLLSQLIAPNIQLLGNFSSGSQSHLICAGIFLVSGACAGFMIYLLFYLKTLSFQAFLFERDEANRYKYMFNSIKDLIIVENNDKLLYRNKAASKAFKVLERELERQSQNSGQKPASLLDVKHFYPYQTFDEEGDNSSSNFDKRRCYSMRELLKKNFQGVNMAIFTTSKEIGESDSMDKLSQILDKLNQDYQPSIPLFVSIRLIKVQKEVLEDIYEEGDEVMIQIQDVSHRILGQNLKIERQYMAIMNSTVSHEMRNPLNALLSSVEVQQKCVAELDAFLGDRGLADECAETTASFAKSLSVSRSSCKLLKFNVEDILALPQIQQGKFTKNVSHHSVRQSVEEILEIMEHQVREKRIAVAVEYSGFNAPDLVLDEQRFQQILLNFFSNAIKFTRKEGRILVHLHLKQSNNRNDSEGCKILQKFFHGVNSKLTPRIENTFSSLCNADSSADRLVLSVVDNGIGITQEDQGKLFKLFGCLQSTRKVNTKGIGLGLAISKMIAEEFQGSAGVQSEHGTGSAFFCSLAVNKWFEGVATKQSSMQHELSQKLTQVKESQIFEASAMLKKIQASGEGLAKGKRILVVDDEAYNCEILAAIIQAMGVDRSRVDLCMSGEEAIEKVKEGTTGAECCYATILTDLSMPFIDGYQCASQVRTYLSSQGISYRKQPLIAAITGHTECEFYTSAFEAGIDQVYSKPLSSQQISLVLTQVGFKVKLSEEVRKRLE